ncbi:MAG: glycogen/starch/alpha-glucan phosphorylase [Vulcanibacillus sp.]
MFRDKETFKKNFLEKIVILNGKNMKDASKRDIYSTLAYMVRGEISKNWIATNNTYNSQHPKEVFYFSMEYLLGRLLDSNLINLGIKDICKEGLKDLGIDLYDIEEQEADPGLGSGGLGRLAADFLDSLASLQIPGHGYGIRYKYGLFEQRIVDGYQVELHDHWLQENNVWEFRKSDKAREIKFGGDVWLEDNDGKIIVHYENYESVIAVPYDIPIVGYQNNVVNFLRLWNAEPMIKDFDYNNFNHRDYHRYVEYKRSTEAISEILYPDDSQLEGKILRLKQQYFLVSASIQNILYRYKKNHRDLSDLSDKIVIHINDTHPVLVIPELMRILMDEEGFSWDKSWSLTSKIISYTNHTTLTEALEKWNIDILRPLLPRIYMIIEEINKRLCKNLWTKYPGEWDKINEMAIISNNQVKMANLAIVSSFSVNGVSEDHSEIIKKQIFNNLYQYFPKKFNNKTNGITHRRWLYSANPHLADAISERIGDGWIKNPTDLINILDYVNDKSFKEQLSKIKQGNKKKLAYYIEQKYNLKIDVNSIFDAQVKRIHAYKRQLLNLFNIMDMYNHLREDSKYIIEPRTFIFAGKAAPGYHLAKNIIKLINNIADVINNDKKIKDMIKVVFIENYSVSLAEKIIPAIDVSEQISTASKEASGTGNMKLMMNGAVTLGTLDGANIEISDLVGKDNIYIFGLKSNEVLEYNKKGNYHAREIYNSNSRLKAVVDQLVNGYYSKDGVDFRSIYYSILENDNFYVLKDFSSYVKAQNQIEKDYKDQSTWSEKSIVNIAYSGKFSSDLTIAKYASDIWDLKPIEIKENIYQS